MINNNKSGFTLFELSIVLLIIGMILGGIVVARDLVKTARLRSVINGTHKIEMAFSIFKEKYSALPGDMTNATSYWGADSSCPTTSGNSIQKTATCDGNGNGYIDGDSSASGWWRESFRAMQQLANAGFLPNLLSGTALADGTLNMKVGINVPEVIPEVGAFVTTYDDYGTHPIPGTVYSAYSHNDIGGVMMVGRASTVLGNNSNLTWTTGPFLTGSDMFALDSKIDDGKPAYGDVQTWSVGWMPACASSDTPASSVYQLKAPGQAITVETCSFYKIITY